MNAGTGESWRSSRHYVEFSAISTALRTTLELAAQALDRPISLLHILDETEQYVLAEYGAPGLAGTVSDSQRATCVEVMRTGEPLVVEDAEAPDVPRRVAEPLLLAGIRSYVGIPLYGREAHPIGTLCVVDRNPRSHSVIDVETLTKYAAVVEEQLEWQRERLAGPETPGPTAREFVTALRDGQVHPWYQPIIDLTTGATTGFEALARWIHPHLGVLTPDKFLPAIVGTDIILDLDRSILVEGARAISAFADITLHANISARHLQNTDATRELIHSIRRCTLPPERIALEITETDLVDSPGPASKAIDALRDMGVQVFLDDLGTGWSTLTRLIDWTFDGIKLDRSIASALGTVRGDSLIGAIANHARIEKLPVVVEGVETPEQAQRARDLGCTHAQGYYYSRPRDTPALV